MPRILIDSKHLGKIPRSHPEELNNISLVDRLNRLEYKMAQQSEVLNEYISQTGLIKETVDNLASRNAPSYSEVVSHKPPPSGLPIVTSITVSEDLAASEVVPNPPIPGNTWRGGGNFRGRSRGRAGRGAFTANQSDTCRPGGLPSRNTNNLMANGNMYSSNHSLDQSSIRSESGSYHLPYHQQKKERQTQRRIIQGKANSKCGVRGAPEPHRQLFIYRVDKATTEHDMTSLLQDSGHDFNIKELKCMSHPEAMYKSFKLSVPVSQYENLFDDGLWPSGVCVRKYIPPRSDH